MNILKKYKYRLNNLECANCANKIEERLKKENNLSDVVVNFSSLTLSFMSNDDIKIEDISNIVTKIEPEVVVTKIDEESKETKKNYNLIRLIIGAIILLIPSTDTQRYRSTLLRIRPVNAYEQYVLNNAAHMFLFSPSSALNTYLLFQ